MKNPTKTRTTTETQVIPKPLAADNNNSSSTLCGGISATHFPASKKYLRFYDRKLKIYTVIATYIQYIGLKFQLDISNSYGDNPAEVRVTEKNLRAIVLQQKGNFCLFSAISNGLQLT